MSAGEPRWISKQAVLVLHDRSIALHGGRPGVRDDGLLESALQRAANRFGYDGVVDISALAATYLMAVASNHPFIDGNKRAALLAAALFLERNGRMLVASPADAALTVFAVAGGQMDEPALAQWIEANSAPRPPVPGEA